MVRKTPKDQSISGVQIYDNSHDTSFLSVCYLQRKIKISDLDHFLKIEKDINEIKKIVVGDVSDGYFHFDDVKSLKELIFSISIAGIEGKSFFMQFCTNFNEETKKKVADLVFIKNLADQLTSIQKFSEKYDGYDALSLITFEKIDYYINYAKKLHDEYRIIREKTVGLSVSNIFPKCYHESEVEPFLKLLVEENRLKNIAKRRPLVFEIDPLSPDFNFEKTMLGIIKIIQTQQKEAFGSLDFLEATPSIDAFVKKMNPNPSKRPKRKKMDNILSRLIGLRIWDLVNLNKSKITVTKAIEKCKDWYGEKYPNIKDDAKFPDVLTTVSLKKNYYDTCKCIENGKYI